ncbi:MAG: methyl-accepting chemotaxis protein [Armatimonadota bacterium]|nr:methyl-accepting chemotaxis protein [bacterium]
MKWFNDLKLRVKLIMGFALVALIAGIVGMVGITNIKKIVDADTRLYEKMTVPISELSKVPTDYQKVRIYLRDAILANTPVETKAAEDNASTTYDEMNAQAAKFEKTITDEKLRNAYKDYTTASAAYKPVISGVAKLAAVHKRTEAAELMKSYAGVAANLQAAVDKMVALKIAEAHATSKNNAAMANSASRAMIALIFIAIMAAIGIGLMLAKVIGNPVKELCDVADKLAIGDVDVNVNTNSKDEIGDLSRSMQAMVNNIHANAEAADKIAAGNLSVEIQAKSDKDVLAKSMSRVVNALRSLVTEADTLTQAAVGGRLEARCDAAKFDGGYKEILDGVNNTLDAVVGPLNVAAEYVERISNGDIPDKITDNYNGDFNEIKNNLNRCIDAINEMVADTTTLGEAAVNGILDTRADASKHQGDFRKIVQGINDSMDSIVTPLSRAIEHLGNVSKGIIPEHISRQYKGEYQTLTDGFNGLFASIRALIDDATMLSEAAVEGKLSTRADLSKHQGDFRAIMQGINDTMDAVVNPVNAAAETLERLAQNDLTARMDGSYQGDYAKIKQSVNTAMETLENAILQVADASVKVAGHSQTLSAAVDEVGRGTQQISETIQQVAAGSQEQSKTVQSSAQAMEQLGRSIGEVAQGAQSQARVVDDTVGLVQQITTAIGQVAKSAQEAAGTSQQVSEVATEGGKQVAEAVGSMDRIKDATDRVADMVKQLGESSQQIGAIVETIDDIAEQTNLLALNAAIEAARAGEHGKGFAVVADEVRKLAERSSKATGEIAELISGIRQMTEHAVTAMELSSKEVFDGTELSNQAGVALRHIEDAIASVVSQVLEVAAAAQQMTGSSNEVIKAIENVSAITEESTAATEEMAAASTEVATQIEQVAAVSQENAAASEEVSATAEQQNGSVEEMTAAAGELATMAEELESLVGQFNVGDAKSGNSGTLRDVSSDVTLRKRKKAA